MNANQQLRSWAVDPPTLTFAAAMADAYVEEWAKLQAPALTGKPTPEQQEDSEAERTQADTHVKHDRRWT